VFTTFPHKIKVEKLNDPNSELTDFYFQHAANMYVFSYERGGQRKHTLIDSGYLVHRDQILPILRQHHIDLKQIENIIITHRHVDHCGLARQLALLSGARILVHAEFKRFVEGDIPPQERLWLGKLDPGQFQQCDIEYLDPDSRNMVEIEGVRFPRLGDSIPIGASGKLEILACPVSEISHSPDQLIVRYLQEPDSGVSPFGVNHKVSNMEMIFSGDLWLMTGPIIEKNLRMVPNILRYGFFYLKERLAGRKIVWDDPRDQDAVAKDALKKGFSLVRVKPGHGEEFLGCRMVPNALFADRDLLVKLGYAIDEDPAVLLLETHQKRLTELREIGYRAFVDELQFWLDAGAETEEISKRLQRIYYEQQGGGKLAALDRLQRRERILELITRMEGDTSVSEKHRQIACIYQRD